VNKRGTTPANNFYPQKRERKRKEEKKGYTLQTAREAAAVKVFCQNTTRPTGGVEIVTKTRRA